MMLCKLAISDPRAAKGDNVTISFPLARAYPGERGLPGDGGVCSAKGVALFRWRFKLTHVENKHYIRFQTPTVVQI